MASEVIKLNLIPKGEMPVFHASQFDTGRLITCELYRGEDAYSVPEGYTVELHCRKVDNNIVTMASTLINDNVVTFTSTEQLTACNGNNICEVAILDEGYRIGTLNFILEVEIDPLKGGITSTSVIHNLETQVEEITSEVIGENYYNKTEVDDLLDTKADASSVYTKSETDTKLALKANAADVYTKSQTDTLLNAKASITYVDGEISAIDNVIISMQTDIDRKADASDVYTKTQSDTALATKADKSDTYTKEQVDNIILDIMPVDTAGPASIASFDTALAADLVDCKTTLAPSLTGYTAVNLTANGDTSTIALGDTYYGGTLDVTTGVLTVNNVKVALSTLTSSDITKIDAYPGLFFIKSSVLTTTWGMDINADTDILCDNGFTYAGTTSGGNGQAYNNGNMTMTLRYAEGDERLYIRDDSCSTTADLLTAIASSNLIYPLATPVTVQISPTAVRVIVGTNNVFADTGDITVKYKDSIQHYIDKKVST